MKNLQNKMKIMLICLNLFLFFKITINKQIEMSHIVIMPDN